MLSLLSAAEKLPVTEAQFRREKIRQLREAREAELRLLAAGRQSADPRYVRDAVAYSWARLLDHKLERREALRPKDRRRLDTLIGLLA